MCKWYFKLRINVMSLGTAYVGTSLQNYPESGWLAISTKLEFEMKLRKLIQKMVDPASVCTRQIEKASQPVICRLVQIN